MRVGRHELVLERRPDAALLYTPLTAALAILLALGLSSVLFFRAEGGVLAAYRVVFTYAFTNPHGLGATVHRAIYLLLCTFAFLVPLRAGLWNIGLPGQVYAGALAAFAVPFWMGAHRTLVAPAGPTILLMVLAAVAAGALLGGIAGVLRTRLQVNEILVTMMLNSVVFWLVADLIKEGGPLMSATAEGESFVLPASLQPPLLWGLPFTGFVVLAGAVGLEFLFARAAFGYRVRAFGHNPAAARYGGVDPVRLPLLVFLVGGAFAGLAGYHYFAAVPGLYKIPSNYGYYGDLSFYGIICALIARGSAVGTVPIALLFSGLSVGARFAQGGLRLPFGVDYAMLGLLMITFVASHALYRFRPSFRPTPPEAVPGISPERP